MKDEIITLGIETSCDETAASLIRSLDATASSVILSQERIHAEFGGITPEIASRKHIENIDKVVKEALFKASLTESDIELIAVTIGPGLAGSLLVGISYAKGLAFGLDVPLVGVNHLEGHMESALISVKDPEFPILFLLVSGGHTELYLKESFKKLKRLGGTKDDAAGEAFDKVARLIGLEYPGGVAIDRISKTANPRFDIPIALNRSDSLDFSFSGPKTAARELYRSFKGEDIPVADIAASFQKSVVDALLKKSEIAINIYFPKSIALVGGVAANSLLRERFKELADRKGLKLLIPSVVLCQDNAEMIAMAGLRKYLLTEDKTVFQNFIDLDAYPSLQPDEV